jgi:hypothetical protein
MWDMLTAGSLGEGEEVVQNGEARRAYARGGISRLEFLRLGGVGLTGVALLGAAGCGGGEDQAEGTIITVTFIPDEAGDCRR